jgi:hypothetical protein
MKARPLRKRNEGFYFRITSSIYFYRAGKLWSHCFFGWQIISNNYPQVERLFDNNYATKAELKDLNVPPCDLV